MDRMGGGGEEKSLVLSPPPLPTRVLREKSPTSLLLYPSLARMSSQALLTPWLWACALTVSSAWTAFPTAPRYLLCQLLGICQESAPILPCPLHEDSLPDCLTP